jgi:hypothetical protein
MSKNEIKNNQGQINIANDNAKITAEQNTGSKYTVSGGVVGAMGDNAKAENIIINQSKETNDIDKIKELILELLGKINSDTEIDNGVKEKIQKAINTTDKQIESGDKDMLEVCVDNLENVGNGVEKGTEVFKKVMVLVGLIRTTFGF